MSKKETPEYLKGLFLKHHVLDMKLLYKAINTTSHATAFRYLCELDHLTSYTHNGKYYTLPEIAQFDPNGFWYYGDIGFSSYGTLVNTPAHVIAVSESGKTNSELEAHFRTRVQDALRTLLNTKKIARSKPGSSYLYVSSDPDTSDLQIKKRMKVGGRKRLPEWIVGEILVETIRSFPTQPQIDDVVKRLNKRGSLITKEQVVQVFEEYNLEKKTLD